MTTPNQDAPDGAVIVGGGEWKYGQLVNERRARQLFEIDAPSNLVEAVSMLPFVLSQLPNESLRPFQRWLNVGDEEAANGTLRQRIIDSLGKGPLRRLINNLVAGFSGTADEEDKTPEDVQAFAAEVAAAAFSANTNVGLAFDNAQAAADFAGQILDAGSNLIVNADFEKGLISPQPLVGVYSEDQKYSGTRSLRMQGTGATKTFYLLSEGLTPRTIPASPGDTFYCEMWVYGTNITQSVTAGLRLLFEPLNRLGGNLEDSYVGLNVATSLNNNWSKVFGFVTLPPDTARFKVGVQLRNTVTAGFFYIDQVIVREVTVAKTAQETIDTKARDLSNLAGGSDFEGSTQPWTLGTGWSIATDRFYVGTRSLKHSGAAAGTSTLAGTFACLPGEQFYVECYARRDSTFNGGTADKIRLVNQAGVEIGGLGFGAAAIGVADAWVKLSTTVTVPAGTSSSFTVSAVSNSTAGSVWLDNIVIRRVVTADVVGVLPQSKVTDLSANLTTIDGKAAAAQGAAATADGKAVAAQGAATAADGKAQGTLDNLIQGVENTTATGATPTTAKTKLRAAWASLFDGLKGGGTGATSKFPSDVSLEALALKLKADSTDLSLGTTNTNQGTLVDHVNNSLNGEETLSGTTLTAALNSLRKTYRDLMDNITSIQELKAKRDGTFTKGATFTVNFSDFSTMSAAGFSVSYTGAGLSTIGISGGVAQWNVNDSSARDAKIIYSQSTATDFQSVRGTMSAPPQPATLNGTTPYFYAITRVSPDGLNYVWARAYAQSFGNYKADIGYTVNGVEQTPWVTGINLTWSLDMRFVAGLGTNARQYQIWSGNNVVYTYNEAGTNSRLCSLGHATPDLHPNSGCVPYRQWGAIAQVRNGRTAGKVSSTAASDNGTPTVNGSCARLVRTSTADVSFVGSNTVTALGGSFFDAAPYESLDVDADPTNGTFKVNISKPYIISARVRLSGNAAALAYLLLQTSNNGSTWTTAQYGPAIVTDDGQALSASWVQYLTAGQFVRLAYTRNGAFNLNVLSGESSGAQTYFTIASAEGAG